MRTDVVVLNNPLRQVIERSTYMNSISMKEAARLMKNGLALGSTWQEIAVRDGDQFRLTVSIYFWVFKEEWLVPEGSVTDFASIPKIFPWIYPPWRKDYGPAAILHDWLRRTNIVPKERADGIFYQTMKECGVGFFTRNLFYRAVRGLRPKSSHESSHA